SCWAGAGASILRSQRWLGIAFNQSSRETQPPSQMLFLPRHFAAVACMIISCEMQDSMQSQDSNFLRNRMPQSARIPSGDVERNRNIAGKAIRKTGRGK